jgi:hypothetical protein
MARAIRTKGGRLKTSVRRRRIRAAGAKPGEVVLLDVTRKRTKGVRGKNSILIDMVVETQWAADLDVRKLLHEIRVNLAEHYQAALLSGMKPDGSGPHPPLKRDKGRKRGVLTGEMAKRWGLGKITGGPFRASTKIRPFDSGERAPMLARELKRGNDFQAITGTAAKVIQETVAAWVRDAIPASGDGVGTPESVPQQGGELPQLRNK